MNPIIQLGIPRRHSYEMVSQFSAKNILVVVDSVDEFPEFLTSYKSDVFFGKKDTPVTRVLEIFSESFERVIIYRPAGEASYIQQIAEVARKYPCDGVYIHSQFSLSDTIEGVFFGMYTFDILKKENQKKSILHIQVITDNSQKELPRIESNGILRKIDSVCLARDLVNLPANLKNPEILTDFLTSLTWKNTDLDILRKKELENNNFGMLLAVSTGSDTNPSVVIFREKGEKHINPEIAFVGKGVTFDAGGLQIKPDDGMADMKCDMAGAAAVIASMWYFDMMGYPESGCIGAIGLVENLLGAKAFKPGDVYQANNGLSVEIGHTDAEGRLVLGDVSSYVSKTYEPKSLVTIATLTGACIVALGFNYAGLVTKDNQLRDMFLAHSEGSEEKLWPLPLDNRMKEATRGTISDRKNISRDMKAGASMGAAFIAEFIPETVKYAHIDIAGPAYRSDSCGIFPKNATGFGVLTLIACVHSQK